MGLLDSLLSGMGGGDTNSFGIPKTGIAGLDNFTRSMEEKANQPHPGKLCIPGCQLVGSERCPACLEQQKAVEQSLYELQKLDEAIRSPRPQTTAKPRPVKCAVCGAPIESGARECPYCSAAYPAFDEPSDLPESDYDRDQLYLTRAAGTHRLYSEMYLENMSYSKRLLQNKMPKFMQGLTGTFADQLASAFQPMTEQQIRQGAQQNGVSYYEYVYGVITGVYKGVPLQNFEERTQAFQQQAAQSRAAQQEYFARNRQIEQERQAKIRAIRKEQNDRMIADAKNHVAHYNGGGGGGGGGGGYSHCCGTCEFYRIYDKHCLANEFRHPSGPNDPACNQYRWLR